MPIAAWRGPGLIVAGLLVGGLLAGGMDTVVAHRRGEVKPILGPAALPAPISLQVGPGDATQGRIAYERMCAACHGTTGKGDVPLHGPLINVYYRDSGVLVGLIRNGVGTMPGTPIDQMPDQQVTDAIAFLRALP